MAAHIITHIQGECVSGLSGPAWFPLPMFHFLPRVTVEFMVIHVFGGKISLKLTAISGKSSFYLF